MRVTLKFSNLTELRLPKMSVKDVAIILDRISEAENADKMVRNTSATCVEIHGLFPTYHRHEHPNLIRALKKVMSTFENVQFVCGYFRENLVNKSNDSGRESRKRSRHTLSPPVVIIAEGNIAVDDLKEFTPMPPPVALVE